MLFNFGQNKTKQNQTSTTAATTTKTPWDETLPYLKDLLGGVGSLNAGLTPDQMTALDTLKGNAGNPWAGTIGDAATATFANAGPGGSLDRAKADYDTRLGKYADGDYLDVGNDPVLQNALKVARGDASDSINQLFAGGGRLYSDTHANALGRGITSAEAPILLDQLNREKANQMNAAGALYGAAGNTATTQAGLNREGVGLADSAVAARDLGASRVFDLESLKTMAPAEQYQAIAKILFPAAGLGGTQDIDSTTKASGTSKEKKSGFSLSLF